MRIGLDFDGTIAGWGGAMARWLQLNDGPAFDPDRNIIEQVTRDRLQTMVREILGSALTLEMQPVEGALEVMAHMRDEAHELYVVTARHDAEALWATRWLQQHAAAVTDLVFTSRASKTDACRRVGLDVLLDDTPQVLAEVLAADGLSTLPVLFETRFRSDEPRPPALRTVARWSEFEALCAEFATRRSAGAGRGP